MLYSSRNGTLFYYDRVLYTWQVAEPTMLFLLGLESVTSYMNALSDTLVIANSVYIKDQNDVVPFEHFKIYDKIHSYLSQLSGIEDFEYYLKFNCNGLKLLLNELTGIGSDRTVPIIFRNDVNNKSIDLNSSMSRLESSETATLYDRQAQKIRDIFSDADYSSGSLIDTSDIEDASIAKYLKAYNVTLSEYYSERRKNGQIYKLLDYNAMYSYALGVLYGCRCLGFSPTLIWRIDPKFWYNGEFKNLVSTAWYAFRFHHTHYIPELDEAADAEMRDRYKGITPNRLWNIGSDKEIDKLDELPLKASELNCYALHIDKTYDTEQVLINEQAVAEPLIYSQFSESDPTIRSVYISYYVMSAAYRCFILSAFGDSLPISGDYHFVISITDKSGTEHPENVIVLDPIDKQSSSKNLFIFSTSEDDYTLYEYLGRFYNLHEQIEISVEIKLGSDSLYKEEILRWDNIKPHGECLPLSDLENLAWVDVNNIISDGSDQDPKAGIVAEKDSPIVRYLADDPIVIRKAYQWVDPIYMNYIDDDSAVSTTHQLRESKYLSPNENEIYFIATGNLGWSYFDENLYKKSNVQYPYKLSIIPYSTLDSEDRAEVLPSRIAVDDHEYVPINYARRKKDSAIVTYYRCYVSDSNENESFDDDDNEDIFMYGIFDGNVSIDKEKDAETDAITAFTYDYSTLVNYHDDEAHKSNPTSAVGFFKEFISEELFAACYEADISIIDGYSLENWYDIDVPVSIFVYDEDRDYVYAIEGESPHVLISNYGYTPSKASAVAAYEYDQEYRDENDLAIPKPYEMRFYNGKYWSSRWGEPRLWRTADQVPYNIYMLAGSVTPIYRGQILIQYEATVYSNINRNDNQYIFNDSSIQYVNEDFIAIKPPDWDQSIDTVWRYGYTTHVCPYILRDDNGNYLTSDGTSSGTPLVWYDQESSMYWNGLAGIMRWQTLKPVLNGQLVYITTTDQYSQAIDDPANEIISLDESNYIPYSEFYSDNTRGAVRYKVKVFNPTKDEGIIDCLVDDKNDPDHPENIIYCIPGVTTTWVPRSGISNEGYRFVDGMTSLYSGADKVDVVIDDDFVD